MVAGGSTGKALALEQASRTIVAVEKRMLRAGEPRMVSVLYSSPEGILNLP